MKVVESLYTEGRGFRVFEAELEMDLASDDLRELDLLQMCKTAKEVKGHEGMMSAN